MSNKKHSKTIFEPSKHMVTIGPETHQRCLSPHMDLYFFILKKLKDYRNSLEGGSDLYLKRGSGSA
jgi:hypothetical protein